MEEAEDKFGKKGTARAGLTLGIIGTALAALGNNNGCGCGGNGILGGQTQWNDRFIRRQRWKY